MPKETEEDVKSRYINPALIKSGWDFNYIYCEYRYIDGQIIFDNNNIKRGKVKKVDYLLKHSQNNLKLAIVEVKESSFPPNHGLEQAKKYAKDLDIYFAYSSNGKGFVEFDFFTGKLRNFNMDSFPTQEELYQRYLQGKEIKNEQKTLIESPYYLENKLPRYYQKNAVDRVIEAIAKGQDRLLLVMATGTGKTFTAFEIVYRLYQAKKVKKVLYLADRNVLADQAMSSDFAKVFSKISTKIGSKKQKFDPSYQIYFSLYQPLFGLKDDEESDSDENSRELFRLENGGFTPDFFNLIIIDECHRGSVKDDSLWRRVLEYFSSAIHIGMTATPKNDAEASNIDYFGEPIYTYSLKQGIQDGFLAPYKVIRVGFNIDDGYRPEEGKKDINGESVPDRLFERSEYNKTLIIQEHNEEIARYIMDYLVNGLKDRYAKTIVFCEDTEHALKIRDELIKLNADMCKEDPDYIVRITGNEYDKEILLDNFVNSKKRFPVIATTSKLLTTGVDTKMVKVIAIAVKINSTTSFKQIIGRGTRIDEEKGKTHFSILDFTGATKIFADPKFDGEEYELLEIDPKKNNFNDKIKSQEDLKEQEKELEKEKRKKLYIDGVDVFINNEQGLILSIEGKLISDDFKQYSKDNLINHYPSLKDFLTKWNSDLRKTTILEEFEKNGILIKELRAKEEFKNLDEFDILISLAYNQSFLSRTQRAKKANKILQKYQGQAREVLQILLDKYADYGIEELENKKIFDTSPFKEKFGNINNIGEIFGDMEKCNEIIRKLKEELYKEIA